MVASQVGAATRKFEKREAGGSLAGWAMAERRTSKLANKRRRVSMPSYEVFLLMALVYLRSGECSRGLLFLLLFAARG